MNPRDILPSNHSPKSTDVSILIEYPSKNTKIGFNSYYVDDPLNPKYVFWIPELYISSEKLNSPRHILFLVDTSDSMAGDGIVAVKKTLLTLFQKLNDEDLITVKTFSLKVNEIIAKKSKRSLIRTFNHTINNIEADGGTALNDAILSVADNRNTLEAAHTTVVLLSDGSERDSIVKMSVSNLISEYNKRFNGLPPRFYPIGLGKHYDYQFLRQCAIATNFGMIDARDQSKLEMHVKDILDGLAYGVHMRMQIGSNLPINLGILNYNSVNSQKPMRILKADIQTETQLKIMIDGKAHSVCMDQSIHQRLNDNQQQKEIVSECIAMQVRSIYDDNQCNYETKIIKMKEIQQQYSAYLSQEVNESINKLLILIDKKDVQAKFLSILFGEKQYIEINYQWESDPRLEKLKPLYPESVDYLNTMIQAVKTNPWSFDIPEPGSSISRKPKSSLKIQSLDVGSAHYAVNSYDATSSCTKSKPIAVTLVQSKAPSNDLIPVSTNAATLFHQNNTTILPSEQVDKLKADLSVLTQTT